MGSAYQSQVDRERHRERGVVIGLHRKQLALWAEMEAAGAVPDEQVAAQKLKMQEEISDFEAAAEKFAPAKTIKKRYLRALTAAKKDRDGKAKIITDAKARRVEQAKVVEDAVAEVARLDHDIPTLEFNVQAAERKVTEAAEALNFHERKSEN